MPVVVVALACPSGAGPWTLGAGGQCCACGTVDWSLNASAVSVCVRIAGEKSLLLFQQRKPRGRQEVLVTKGRDDRVVS